MSCRTIIAAATFALAGCDGTLMPPGTTSGADAATVPEPLARELARSLAQAVCEKIDSCCSAEERSRVIGVGEDRAACEANFGVFYDRQYQLAEAATLESRATFDRAQMAACLDAYRDAGCSSPGAAVVRTCATVLVGRTANGGACANAFQCRSRSCATSAVTNAGECKARKPDGEPCMRAGECASGICARTFLSGMCSSRPPEGEACGGDAFWMTF
jgi:hypothetical protein